MTVPCVLVGGRKTVSQIAATNQLKGYAEQNGLPVEVALLSTQTVGGPVD